MYTYKMNLSFSIQDMIDFFKQYGFETYNPDQIYLKKIYKKQFGGFGDLSRMPPSFLIWIKDKKGNPIGPIEPLFSKALKLAFLSQFTLIGLKFDKEDYYDKPPNKKKS